MSNESFISGLDTSLKITGNPKLSVNINVRFTSNGKDLYVKTLDNKYILDNYLNLNQSSIGSQLVSSIKRLITRNSKKKSKSDSYSQ
jgi:hypothetical protein